MSGLRNSFRWRKDTKKITTRIPRSPTGFGFTVAWTKPPEINFVDQGSSASRAGLAAGDKILFINQTKVSKKGKDEITEIVKSIKDEMELEIEREEYTSRRRYQSVRLKGEKSKGLMRTEVNVIAWKKERALLTLLQCEEELLNVLKMAKEKFVLPLRRESRMVTSAELDILFGNSQEVCSLMERFILPLHETMTRSEDRVGAIYLQQMGSRCYALEKYMRGIQLAKILLNYKLENQRFATFLKMCDEIQLKPDICEFLDKPYKYINDVVSHLECLLSYTAVGHHDYVPLEDAVAKFGAFLKNVVAMTEKSGKTEKKSNNGNVGLVDEDPYPNLERLRKKIIFTTGSRPFDLIYPGRYWLFAGQLLKVDGRYYVQHWAMLLSDVLLLTRMTKQGIVIVTEMPLMLEKIRHVIFDVSKCETEFHILFESETPYENVLRKNNYPSAFPPRKWITWSLRAPSVGVKQIWQTIIMDQLSKLAHRMGNASTVTMERSSTSEWCNTSFIEYKAERPKYVEEGHSLQKPDTITTSQGARSSADPLEDESSSCENIFETNGARTPVEDHSLIHEDKVPAYDTCADTIPYIDSAEELSSGTESNNFLDDFESTAEDLKNCDQRVQTADKHVQTDLTCSNVNDFCNQRKTVPKLGTLNKISIIKATTQERNAKLNRVQFGKLNQEGVRASRSVPKGLADDPVPIFYGKHRYMYPSLSHHLIAGRKFVLCENTSMPDLCKFRWNIKNYREPVLEPLHSMKNENDN